MQKELHTSGERDKTFTYLEEEQNRLTLVWEGFWESDSGGV